MRAWRELPARLELRAGTLDIVVVTLVPAGAEAAGWLDAHERRRADRLHRDADRETFVAAHVARRRVLATMLGIAPGNVRITTDPHGKPGLSLTPDVVMNDSNTDDLLMVAATIDATGHTRVGIDVEPRDDGLDAAALQSVVAAPAERGLAHDRFLRLFTAKEAIVKAHGTGLSIDVREIELDLAGDCAADGLAIRVLPALLGEPDDWWIDACDPPSGHLATVAVHGAPPLAVRCWFTPPG